MSGKKKSSGHSAHLTNTQRHSWIISSFVSVIAGHVSIGPVSSEGSICGLGEFGSVYQEILQVLWSTTVFVHNMLVCIH